MTESLQKDQYIQQNLQPQYDPEVEVVGNWKLVDLPQIQVVTGEQHQTILSKFRVKIYRWRSEWKQRGVGQLRFMQDVQSKKIRILVREDKTLSVRANHLVKKTGVFCKLQKLNTNENSWSWVAFDFSDQATGKIERFSVKLRSTEQSTDFKNQFQTACNTNNNL